ncbi:hypothetical protein SAMN05661096_04128 [Marivirga sericea]|uniref:Uncharacterized protein n=1 Tax=Marivirga sericea TaxID=1028 RepID=A0A1X7LM53_9BACT|nr:hypothetical protein [Marivirga sericea]SMG54229.1 hypothetical protein SAMN05661096_04128 [Marivirga sericea]
MQIIDNDGFLALVNSSKFNAFLTEDWEFDQLMNHFVEQMNQGHFLIWRTGYEGGTWNVDFVSERSNQESFRDFEATIEVTDCKLFLTEYSDLTMAASYPKQKIPSNHNSELYHELSNGIYSVTVRQLFNPELDDENLESKTNFEIVLKPLDAELTNQFKKVQWFE